MNIVEQIIRPTGLLDPEIVVKPVKGQIDDLLDEIKTVTDRGERVLVTTLTKRMAEALTDHLASLDIRVRYLHSEVKTVERMEIIRDLRMGEFDVLVGINLLREGLDLPEVGLVAILDADKEGFLRSETSLVQTVGRAARNIHGRVVMYADTVTEAMQGAINETNRRREIQDRFYREHGITPRSVTKSVRAMIESTLSAEGDEKRPKKDKKQTPLGDLISKEEQGLPVEELLDVLTHRMTDAAAELRYEDAAAIRDTIKRIKALM